MKVPVAKILSSKLLKVERKAQYRVAFFGLCSWLGSDFVEDVANSTRLSLD